MARAGSKQRTRAESALDGFNLSSLLQKDRVQVFVP